MTDYFLVLTDVPIHLYTKICDESNIKYSSKCSNTDVLMVIKRDLLMAMQRADDYLASNTYLVGDRITLADLSLAVSLLQPVTLELLENSSMSHLYRWQNMIINLPKMMIILEQSR